MNGIQGLSKNLNKHGNKSRLEKILLQNKQKCFDKMASKMRTIENIM